MKKIKSLEIPGIPLHEFCQRWKVSELALFGSALHENYFLESDLDLLISFEDDAHWGMFDLLNMEQELGVIFNKKVDLIEKEAIIRSENYLRRDAILADAEIIYQSGSSLAKNYP
jgi:predicted nucleotidyltransferase